MVMVKRLDGDKCVVTTVDDNKELELDVSYPFSPINPTIVEDMATLPHINEVSRFSLPRLLSARYAACADGAVSWPGRGAGEPGREGEGAAQQPLHVHCERTCRREPPEGACSPSDRGKGKSHGLAVCINLTRSFVHIWLIRPSKTSPSHLMRPTHLASQSLRIT